MEESTRCGGSGEGSQDWREGTRRLVWSFWRFRSLRLLADPGKHRLSQNELAEMRRSASNISGPPGALCVRVVLQPPGFPSHSPDCRRLR